MKRGYFITGTDTGVGKTFVAALIASSLRKRGVDVGVMKPVETGCEIVDGRLIPADALRLKEASGSSDPLDEVNPYRFKAPLAPNVSARLEGRSIDLKRIHGCFNTIAGRHDVVIVEGAGGFLSPVTESATASDLAGMLKLPVIIVTASRLGAINSTSLTVHAVRTSGLGAKGIVLNHPSPHSDESQQTNGAEIERFTGLRPFELPHTKKEPPFHLEEGLLKYIGGNFL